MYKMKIISILSIPLIIIGCLLVSWNGTSCNMMSDGMMKNGMMDDMMQDNKVYSTNGETIFRTGKNKDGVIIQDIEKSQMKMPHACVSCHGNDGKGGMMMMMRTVPSIKFKDLSDPSKYTVPYTEELVKQFLDKELKSDSTIARTGVAWKMSESDKNDLISFLKTLK